MDQALLALGESVPVLSFMSLAELLSWPVLNAWGATAHDRLVYFLNGFRVLYPDAKTCDCYALVRAISKRRGRPISPQDAWIAATCLRHNVPLLTRNARDFEFIDDLELIPL